MATKIQWTEETWNPIVGCSIATAGCTNCYAMRMAWRLANNPVTPHYAGTVEKVKGKPVWTGKVAMAPDRVLAEPLRRRKPTTYFVNSMGDLFHEGVPDDWIDKVFAVMALAPQHTFQVLTKRAGRMREYLTQANISVAAPLGAAITERTLTLPREFRSHSWPLPNVWLGVSAERQKEADERIPHLLDTPAAVRFVSVEPMLGPVDLDIGNACFNRNAVIRDLMRGPSLLNREQADAAVAAVQLDWIIVGGESGPGARPMHPDWARTLRDQCQAAGVPFFFKQWGEWGPGECADHAATRTEDTATWWDGGWEFDSLTPRQSEELHRDAEPDLYRLGKTRAGRTLDGREWNEMPEREHG